MTKKVWKVFKNFENAQKTINDSSLSCKNAKRFEDCSDAEELAPFIKSNYLCLLGKNRLLIVCSSVMELRQEKCGIVHRNQHLCYTYTHQTFIKVKYSRCFETLSNVEEVSVLKITQVSIKLIMKNVQNLSNITCYFFKNCCIF